MKWLLPIFLAIIMAGCATPPPLVPTGLEEPGVWARTGRFAVTVEELDGRQHAVQGGLSWRGMQALVRSSPDRFGYSAAHLATPAS